jgi:adenosylhomocysteine nucleosidase
VAHSGVGKVNAAMTATVLLDHFRPREVLFTGAAGGLNPELAPGDIVLGAKTVQHDYGNLSPHGFQPEVTRNPVAGDYNPLFFTAAESLLAVAETAGKDVALAKVPSRQGDRLPKIMTGVVATGDVFVSAPAKSAQLREQFQADAVEMEGAAVAQICWQQNMPCLVIRCVSDKADAAAAADFARFREVAAANSAKLTVRTLELLAQKPK